MAEHSEEEKENVSNTSSTKGNSSMIIYDDKDANSSLARLSDEFKDDPLIAQLRKADLLAEYVIHSETYGPMFQTPVYGEDGITLLGYKRDKSAVIACITLGFELDIPPMVAVCMNKQLDANAYLKVQKGKSLGLDVTSALQNVSCIRTKNGMTYHLGVHIITKALIDLKVKMQILEDYKPIYHYNHAAKGYALDITDDEVNRETTYFAISTDKKKVAAALEKGLIAVTRKADRRTTIRFIRESIDMDITIPYTLQEATDAGLYRGYHSELVDADNKPLYVEGKDNWNNNPARMLRNRVISIGGNIIAGDKLEGCYTNDEIEDVLDSDKSATLYKPNSTIDISDTQ